MKTKSSPGQVITFYSYKGGTGRSMALANVACYLARKARVLAVDWDLDAPGLGQFFRAILDVNSHAERGGVLEFFERWSKRGSARENGPENYDEQLRSVGLSEYVTGTTIPNLSFMAPGRIDRTYAKRLAELDWQALHKRLPGLIPAFAAYLSQEFDYCLIDSRSGFSDTAGICTAMLPEKLVAVFAPNRQNLEGLKVMIERAVEYRKQSDDIRPLVVFPLPSRIDTSEPRLREEWRFAQLDVAKQSTGYQGLFEKLFTDLYGLQSCNLSSYFDEIQIQHVPRYSYGEEIAIRIERGERLSLSRSYSEFGEALTKLSAPWEARPSKKVRERSEPLDRAVIDQAWFDRHFETADRSLRSMGFAAFAEVRVSLLSSQLNADQSRLLDAARASQIKTFGWPIGVTLDGRPEYVPRPTNEGIVAVVSIKDRPYGDIYDYWTWRRNGDFYMMQNFFEDDHEGARGKLLYFDVRIVRLAEALLYCSRVYRRLGVRDETPIQFTARWAGLKGRELRAAEATRFLHPRGTIEDEVVQTVELPLSRIRADLVGVVKELLGPLFIVFDFFKLSDQNYQQIVDRFVQQSAHPRPGAQVFRVDMEHLRLEAEQVGNSWACRVYDMSDFMTLYETECDGEMSAKVAAVAFAMLNLGRRADEGEPPEALARSLPWKLHGYV